MANYDYFTIKTESISMLEKVYPELYFFSDSVRNGENGIRFCVNSKHNTSVVEFLKNLSVEVPDETIHLAFAAEMYHCCKSEKYEIKGGKFIFKGIDWEHIKHDNSDNVPELLSLLS